MNQQSNILKDPISRLNDNWWSKAKTANRWKQKFECITELIEQITGYDIQNFPDQIANHKKADILFSYLSEWLENENHVFVRLNILKIMPTLIRSFDNEIILKYSSKIIHSICYKQWGEKKKEFHPLTSDVLFELWIKTQISLNNDDFKPCLLFALTNKRPELRENSLDFIAKCASFSSSKHSGPLISGYIRFIEKLLKNDNNYIIIPRSIILLCHSYYFNLFNLFMQFIHKKDILNLLSELAINDKNLKE